MAALILAPHFDDAVYSCGALIARRAAKERVTLLTVCGGAIPADAPATAIVRELHARWRAANEGLLPDRRGEEQAAAALLGATVATLPGLDAIYRRGEQRRALYARGSQLATWPRPDDPLPSQLRARDWLAAWLAEQDSSAPAIYLPLAVGGHVDHRITRDWALASLAARPALAVYAYGDFSLYAKRWSGGRGAGGIAGWLARRRG